MFKESIESFNIELDSNKNPIKKPKKKKKIIKIIFICSVIIVLTLILFLIFFFNRNETYNQTVQIEKEEKKENKIEELEELIELEKKEKEENESKKSKKFMFKQSNDPLVKFNNEIPGSLFYNNDGYCELDGIGFERISNDNKEYIKENTMIIDTTSSNQMAQINEKMDIKLDIAVYHNDVNFETEINKIIEKKTETESKSYSFIAKIKLGSITINMDDIKLTENFINKINKIANNKKASNEYKAHKLNELINVHGYYIPLTINFGGLFMIESQYIKNSETEKYITIINGTLEINDEADINPSYKEEIKNILNEFYSNSKKTIIGGDYTKDNFYDWKSSINENNATTIIIIPTRLSTKIIFDDNLNQYLLG